MQKREQFTKENVKGIDYFDWYAELDRATDDPTYKMILVNTIRQASKSTWALSVNMLYNLFNVKNWQGAGIATSKDTFKSIFRSKIADVVNRSPRLKADARVHENYISVPRMGSYFELLPAQNVGAVVGRSLDSIFIDEAALCDDTVIPTLMPAILARKNAKIICVSSSWSPRGFFYDAIMAQEKNPEKEVFLFRNDSRELNKYASMDNLDFMSKTLMRINPAYEKRFLSCEFAEIGDEFLPRAVIDASVDYDLTNKPTSKKPCFAFLDLSTKHDLTSRVIVEADKDHYTAINLEVINPKGLINKRIDFDQIKEMIKRDVTSFNIRKYAIDARHESGELINWCVKQGIKLIPFQGTVKSNQEIWGRLSEVLSSGRLTIPSNKRLLDELRNLRIEEFSMGRSFRVTDGSKRLHRDLSMSLAGALFYASEAKGRGEPQVILLDDNPEPAGHWIEVPLQY